MDDDILITEIEKLKNIEYDKRADFDTYMKDVKSIIDKSKGLNFDGAKHIDNLLHNFNSINLNSQNWIMNLIRNVDNKYLYNYLFVDKDKKNDLINRVLKIFNTMMKTNSHSISLMDGHGRTVFLFLFFSYVFDYKINIYVYEIDWRTHLWHTLFFPIDVVCIYKSISVCFNNNIGQDATPKDFNKKFRHKFDFNNELQLQKLIQIQTPMYNDTIYLNFCGIEDMYEFIYDSIINSNKCKNLFISAFNSHSEFKEGTCNTLAQKNNVKNMLMLILNQIKKMLKSSQNDFDVYNIKLDLKISIPEILRPHKLENPSNLIRTQELNNLLLNMTRLVCNRSELEQFFSFFLVMNRELNASVSVISRIKNTDDINDENENSPKQNTVQEVSSIENRNSSLIDGETIVDKEIITDNKSMEDDAGQNTVHDVSSVENGNSSLVDGKTVADKEIITDNKSMEDDAGQHPKTSENKGKKRKIQEQPLKSDRSLRSKSRNDDFQQSFSSKSNSSSSSNSSIPNWLNLEYGEKILKLIKSRIRYDENDKENEKQIIICIILTLRKIIIERHYESYSNIMKCFILLDIINILQTNITQINTTTKSLQIKPLINLKVINGEYEKFYLMLFLNMISYGDEREGVKSYKNGDIDAQKFISLRQTGLDRFITWHIDTNKLKCVLSTYFGNVDMNNYKNFSEMATERLGHIYRLFTKYMKYKVKYLKLKKYLSYR
jgi:hypothetical protein